MDLSDFSTRQKSHEGVDIPLVIEGEPAIGDDGKPVTFRVKGTSDNEVWKLLRNSRRREFETRDEMVEDDLKLARVAVVGWSANWTFENKKLPYSVANVEKVFRDVDVIRENILAEVGRRRNFTKGSSRKPSSTSDS